MQPLNPLGTKVVTSAHLSNETGKRLKLTKVREGGYELFKVDRYPVYAESEEGCFKLMNLLEELPESGSFGKLLYDKVMRKFKQNQLSLVGSTGSEQKFSNLGLSSETKMVLSLDRDPQELKFLAQRELAQTIFREDLSSSIPKRMRTNLLNAWETEKARLSVNPHPVGSKAWNNHNLKFKFLFGQPLSVKDTLLEEISSSSLKFEATFGGEALDEFCPVLSKLILDAADYQINYPGDFDVDALDLAGVSELDKKIRPTRAISTTPDERASFKMMRKTVTRSYTGSDLQGKEVFHGTNSSNIESVLAGPKNTGRGFGGKGLYLSLEHTLAEEYASIKTQFGKESKVLLQGNLNPAKKFRVARIQLAPRNMPGDITKGIFAGDWMKNPNLQRYMLKNFDLIEVCGAKDSGYAIESNRFLVVTERAGNDAIKWNVELERDIVELEREFRSKPLQPNLNPPSRYEQLRARSENLIKYLEETPTPPNAHAVAEHPYRLKTEKAYLEKMTLEANKKGLSSERLTYYEERISRAEAIQRKYDPRTGEPQRTKPFTLEERGAQLKKMFERNYSDLKFTSAYDSRIDSPSLKAVFKGIQTATATFIKKACRFGVGAAKMITHPAVLVPANVYIAYDKNEDNAALKATLNGAGPVFASIYGYGALGEVGVVIGLGVLAAELLPDLKTCENNLPTQEEIDSIRADNPYIASVLETDVMKMRAAMGVTGMIQDAFKKVNIARLWHEHIREPLNRSIDEEFGTRDFNEVMEYIDANSSINPQILEAYEGILSDEFQKYLENYSQIAYDAIPLEGVHASPSLDSYFDAQIDEEPALKALDQEEKKIREFVKENKPPISTIILKMGEVLVGEAVSYLQDKSQARQHSREVKDFVRKFESSRKKLNKQIPKEGDALFHELSHFFNASYGPGKIADEYANIEKSGNELSKAIADAKAARKALLEAKGSHEHDLERLDALENKYKASLSKALKSANGARRKIGLFSTILKTTGAVLSLIPATKIVGGAITIATTLGDQLTSGNADKVRDHRVNKFQNKLSAALEERERLVESLQQISRNVSAIDSTMLAYEDWIFSQESLPHLHEDKRLELMEGIIQDKKEHIGTIEEQIRDKEAEKEGHQKAFNELEIVLNFYRGIPNLKGSMFRSYNEGLANQKKNIDLIEKAESDLKALREKTLATAQAETQKKEDQLAKETDLNPLYKFRRELLQPFARPREAVPTPASFSADSLVLYHQRQMEFLTPLFNLIGATGELSREFYYAGMPLPYHLQSFAQNFVQCGTRLDLLRVAYNEWSVDKRVLNVGNGINHFIVPGIQALAALVGLYNATSSISFLVSRLFQQDQKQETLFDYIHRDLEQQVYQLAHWMDQKFEQARRDLSEKHQEILHHLDQLREQQQVGVLRILSLMNKNHAAMEQEFKDDRFDSHTQRVAMKVETIKTMDLPALVKELEVIRNGLWNGFAFQHTLDLRDDKVWTTPIDLQLVYRQPFCFTGLIAKALGIQKDLPNGELLIASKNALATLDTDDQPKLRTASYKVQSMQEELLSLFDFIPDLIKSLHKEQKALYGEIEASRKSVENEEETLRKKDQKKFPRNIRGKLLGHKRAYLHTLANGSLGNILPEYKYNAISREINHGTHALATYGATNYKWAALDTASFGVLAAVNPYLIAAYAAYRLFIDCRDVAGGFKELHKLPLKDILEEESALQSTQRNSVAVGEFEKPHDRRTLGLDLKNRTVVEVKPGDSPQQLMPFLVADLSIQVFRHTLPSVQLRLHSHEHALVTTEELKKIGSIRPNVSHYNQQMLLSSYEWCIKGHKNPSTLLERLGEFELLPNTNENLIPIALPQSLLEFYGLFIQVESQSAKDLGLGHFRPVVEFSPQTNTLSLVYQLIMKNSAQALPYCKFHLAHFDRATTASFQSEFDQNGLPESELSEANEFLLHALYGGVHQLGLPGDQTLVLKSGLVAPVDRPFAGLYEILKKDPSMTLHYQSALYTEAQQEAINTWLSQDEAETPSMLVPTAGPQYYPEALKIREVIKEARASQIKSRSYKKNYALLMALSKLFSSCPNEVLLGSLKGTLSIYPPKERHLSPIRTLSYAEPDDEIRDFMTMLEETPSQEKLDLRTPLFD